MKNLLIILFLAIFAASPMSAQKGSVRISNLKCESLVNPTGIDEVSPRLSWKLEAEDQAAFGQKQSEYRIIVSSTKALLNKDQGDLWDSKWIHSNETQHIEFQGKPLISDQSCYWKVQVKDESGKASGWSPTASWTTGLLNPADWTSRWIGTDILFDPHQEDCNIPDPWLRKSFTLDKKPSKANLFLASVGYHELYVNGEKIVDGVLAPNVSDHSKRARYIAYDIANKLQKGKNVITIWLGTSWSIFPPYNTENRPATPIVIAQADIYTNNANKSFMRIETDASWKTHPSPNRLLGTWDFGKMGGEIWDANLELQDWNTVNLDDSHWKNANVYHPDLILSAQITEPNRCFKEIHPVDIEQRPDGSFRVDMGENFAGWTQIKVNGKQGDRIDFLFSEREQDEMTFRNYSAFIIGASGEGTFKNQFNYSSGRWITIKGLKEKPNLQDITGWTVRTAYQPATTFECSDSLQNWMYDRIRWTFENLSIGGYVVDCPQRERLGYGGDAHATSETGLFNYQLGAFYSKWMEDWRDVQGTESMTNKKVGGGILPHTAPTCTGGGGPAWGGICVTLPWILYQHEGDRRILEKNFQLISGWLNFLNTHTKGNLLQRFGGNWDFLGDWLWPNATAEGMNNDKPENLCFNNCYYVYNLTTAAKIARTIGKNQEAQKWETQAENTKKAINEKFYNTNDHSYADSSMANLAVALLAEVPPVELRKQVMQRLEKEILVVRNGHIHVGITAGTMLFKLLRETGRDDLIYSMTSQTDYPSWGYMKANGATTIWEMWEKDLPGHSLLHSSYLYPGAWYIDGVAGIRRDPEHPGFRHFIIRPPLLKETQLSWAKASFDSPAGLIKTSWKRSNGKLSLDVSVPPNAVATVYFPTDNASGIKEKSGYAKRIGEQNGYVLFELPAGNYQLSDQQ